MKIKSLAVISMSAVMLACDSSGTRKKVSGPPPPAGMITTIRENAAWRFRIRVGTSGYNTWTSVKVTLNGAEIPSSQRSTEPTTIHSLNETYMNVSLSDESVKTGVLELLESRSSNRGDEKPTRYAVELSELTK
jgi:hypothetical protein